MQSPDDFLKELEADENGHFLIEQRDGRAFLRVTPPGAQGRPVKYADVQARLDLFRLEGYDRAEVEDIVLAADGEFFDICVWPVTPSVDAELQVEIDEDEMQAFLKIVPPRHGGNPVDREMIQAALQAAGVTHGLDQAVIDALDDGSYVDPDAPVPRPGARESVQIFPETSSKERRLRVLIARGAPPSRGKPGRVRLYFESRPRPAPGVTDDEERVDFRKLNVIQSCEKGQVLAEIVAPENGVAGYTVRGGELPPAAPNTAQLHAGKNARLSGDGSRIFADLAGQVRIEELRADQVTRIEVEEILSVSEVDYSTGHIDFPGTVQVEGTVLDGFKVRAAGDIIVQKTVGNVQLQADGDIILAGGAYCKNEGEIVAGQSIFARFVQDARLYAGRDVMIEEAAMTSHIAAGGAILLAGGRGELIGGTALAGRELRARKLGGRSEVSTHITVGIQPDAMQKLQTIDRELLEKQTAVRKIELHLSQMDEAVQRGRTLNESEEATREKLRAALTRFRELVDGLESQRHLLYDAMEPDEAASVEAQETLFPGVEVHFGTGVKRFRVEGRPVTMYSRFVLQDGRIHLKHSDF
ncbi:MAG: FapA family protein [bacterium]|nr:FapA family protein [bacterium]